VPDVEQAVRRAFRKFGSEASGLEQKFSITVKIGPLITRDHRSFLEIEAEDYDNVRKFVTQSGLIQWNSVTTIPVINFETALAELDTLTPIWHLQSEA
jgi:hypothetical protein